MHSYTIKYKIDNSVFELELEERNILTATTKGMHMIEKKTKGFNNVVILSVSLNEGW